MLLQAYKRKPFQTHTQKSNRSEPQQISGHRPRYGVPSRKLRSSAHLHLLHTLTAALEDAIVESTYLLDRKLPYAHLVNVTTHNCTASMCNLGLEEEDRFSGLNRETLHAFVLR